MKNFLKRVSLAVLVLGFSLLTGCAITPPVTNSGNDAVRLACTTATPGLDGVAVTACAIDAQEVDKVTGKNKEGAWARSVHMFNSLPIAGQALGAVAATVPVALIQAAAAKKVAEIGKCGDGANCGTVVNSNATSGSQSQAGNQTDIKVNSKIGTTPPCTGACLKGD